MKMTKMNATCLLKLSILLVLLGTLTSCGTTNEEEGDPVGWLHLMSNKSGLMISNERSNYDYSFYVNPTEEERKSFKKVAVDGGCSDTNCVAIGRVDSTGKKREFDGHLSQEWVDKLTPLFTPQLIEHYTQFSSWSEECQVEDLPLSLFYENIGKDRERGGLHWCSKTVSDEQTKKMLDTLKKLEDELRQEYAAGDE